jgi:hypothetical protein
MDLNTIGLVAAVSTFLGVWFGHVAVRRIESISSTLWLPTTIFAIAGVAFIWLSLSTLNLPLSTALGILGITFLCDANEFSRQQNRVRKGHAPANPNNPRHARLMSKYPSATTVDLLKREPIGNPVSSSEAIKLVTEH